MYNEKPKIDYITIIFIFCELIFSIIIVAILSNILGTKNITTSPTGQPVASITNLRTTIPEVPLEVATTIEGQLYSALLDNSSTNTVLNTSTAASIAEDSVKRNTFDKRGGVTLISAAINVPDAKQSYSFFYGYPEAGNNDFQTFYTILCPVSDAVGSYANFDCRILTPSDVNKESILSTFLSYYDFDLFSATLDQNNSNRIIISPSITYDNDEKTKTSFINETKDAVSSLGFNPDDYEYYVRTAADINYENSDR